MNCQRCHTDIVPGEEREHREEMLCEDCFMEALSPAKACDPWAVYSAKSLERHAGSAPLTAIQTEIIRVLTESGALEPPALLEALEGKVTQPQLEKEFATLRHMEKVRGEKRGDKVFIRLW